MKAVLFDLDNTLHDKSATLRRLAALQYSSFSLRNEGVEQAGWIDAFVAHHNQLEPKLRVFQKLSRQFQLPSAFVDPLLQEYDRECGNLAQSLPGAEALLEACKRNGVFVGCVTNGRDAHQRSKLRGMGLEGWFDSIVTSGAFGAKKPALSIFNACLDELSVEAKDSVFVGDNYEADMVPALKLGMRAIWKSARQAPAVELCTDSLDEVRLHLFS